MGEHHSKGRLQIVITDHHPLYITFGFSFVENGLDLQHTVNPSELACITVLQFGWMCESSTVGSMF